MLALKQIVTLILNVDDLLTKGMEMRLLEIIMLYLSIFCTDLFDVINDT